MEPALPPLPLVSLGTDLVKEIRGDVRQRQVDFKLQRRAWAILLDNLLNVLIDPRIGKNAALHKPEAATAAQETSTLGSFWM